MIYFILVFFLGSVVGSFVNVLIDRTMVGEDWVSGRSHCDHCHKTLAWYDMVPIWSFVFYRGQSRCCGANLSWRYPTVEILSGLLFGWWLMVGFWFFRLTQAPLTVIQPAFWLLSGVIMLVMSLADLFYGVVLLPVVWFGYGLGLVYRLVLGYFGAYQNFDFWMAIVASGVCFGFFWCLHKVTRGRGMAEGDIYVAAYVGLLTGWPGGVLAIGLSFVMGAGVGVMLILTGLRTRKDTLPFVPFLVTAMAVVLVWGDQLIRFLG